jgi:CubicO group peptidase (beta-lactamase class C family)
MITRKLLGYSALFLLVATLLISSLYWAQLRQLYHTIHLFDEDVIVENFSHMNAIIPTISIKRSGNVNKFNHAPQALPDTFQYLGETRTMDSFLTQTSATALVVIKDNNLTFEDYYKGTSQWDQRISWSMAKSFLSAIFGVAVQEGFIKDLNQSVTDYVPSLAGSGYDGVSIKNVLQMSSGVLFNEDYGDFNSDINRFGRVMALGGSFDDFAASLSTERKQGEYMHYVSLDTHVIGMVLRAATGKSIETYFEEKLWSKLGTERDAIYITDSTGQPMVLGGLNLITRDYARMGTLYRDKGVINGEQIIPAQWIEDSITPDAPHLMPGKRDTSSSKFGYGYQWWLPDNPKQEFMALGIYGQHIYVNRQYNVVIVKNSADRAFMDNEYQHTDIALAAYRTIAKSLSDTQSAQTAAN